MRSLIVKIGLLLAMPFPVWASTIIVTRRDIVAYQWEIFAR